MSYFAPPAYYPPLYGGMYPPYPSLGFPYYSPQMAFPPPVVGTRVIPVVAKPKLVYFNGRGRAEIIRLILALVGEDYDDVRFAPNEDNDVNPTRLNDEFAKFKESGASITGQVPYLEIDGLKLVQSMAIARYLAGRYHLCGNETPAQRVKIDMVVDTVQDLYAKYIEATHEKDEERKTTSLKAYWETHLTKYGAILEKFLDANEYKSGFFVGDRLSWADLVVFDFWSKMTTTNSGATLPFEKLAAHSDRIAAVPPIAKWLANRPETQF